METRRYGGLEVWRLAAGVQMWRHTGVELWSSEARCRGTKKDAWSSGALEERYRRADAEV